MTQKTPQHADDLLHLLWRSSNPQGLRHALGRAILIVLDRLVEQHLLDSENPWTGAVAQQWLGKVEQDMPTLMLITMNRGDTAAEWIRASSFEWAFDGIVLLDKFWNDPTDTWMDQMSNWAAAYSLLSFDYEEAFDYETVRNNLRRQLATALLTQLPPTAQKFLEN